MKGLATIVFCSLALCAPALADTGCPAMYAGGLPPVTTQANLAQRSFELCYEAYSVLDSGLTRTALWAAEHVTAAGLATAEQVTREDVFYEETALPPEDRAELADYARSGYDRGHLAPEADMPTVDAMRQSFSLGNVVPQQPEVNRGDWATLEALVRSMARRRGELYVVTGPIFDGDQIQALRGRVAIPTRLFKAIYDPARGEAGAYVMDNQAGAHWDRLSLDALDAIVGFDIFPVLSPTARARAMSLPSLKSKSQEDQN